MSVIGHGGAWTAELAGLGVGAVVALAVGCGHETIDLLESQAADFGASGALPGSEVLPSGGTGGTPGAGTGAAWGLGGTGGGSWVHQGGTGGNTNAGAGGGPTWTDPCDQNYCDPVNEVCDSRTGACIPRCTSDFYCGSVRPRCDLQSGWCVECIDVSDCPSPDGAVKFCVMGLCGECLSAEDCPAARPYCDTIYTLECRECLIDEHCSGGKACDERFGDCD